MADKNPNFFEKNQLINQIPAQISRIECARQSMANCEYRIRSEIVGLEMLRDSYKQKTHETFDEISEGVEEKRRKKHEEAIKAEILLDYNKNMLQQLDNQYQVTSQVLKETVNVTKTLSKRLGQHNRSNQEMLITQASIKKILDDLRG